MRRRGFSIGRLLGIDIRVDPSLLVVLALVVSSLALGAFPAWHPDWGAGVTWMVSLVTGVLLIVSILLHELAHAVVARAYRLPVGAITLHVFGGVASIEEEPPTPWIEFAMAVVGPLVSLAIGVACLGLGALWIGPIPPGTAPEVYAQQLGPVPTVLAWLGPVNLALGVFNLLPGFPLDGGRVLRAAVWAATGSLAVATRWSARGGVAIGLGLVGVGVAMALGFTVPLLGTGLLGGMWLALIGWFLARMATLSERRLTLETMLQDVRVGDVMARHLRVVPPELTLSELALRWAGEDDQVSWPVVDGDQLVGVVRLDDLRRVRRDRWEERTVASVMVPASQLPVVAPGEPANDALKKLATTDADHVAVTDGGRWLGLVRALDVVRWLQLHTNGHPA